MPDLDAVAGSQFVALVLALAAVVALWRAREADRVRYDEKTDKAWEIVGDLTTALREGNRLALDSRREPRA